MTPTACSGCGTLGTRIDRCKACSGGQRPAEDARRTLNRARKKGHTVSASPTAPPTTAARWALWFVPFGREESTLLDRLSTADAGQKLAEVHNRLDWMTHDALGSDALIAMGRKGSFILEPILR